MSNYFKNIIGHQKALQLLTADLEQDNLAHAYLLSGPADLGKFTVAKLFAKAVQTRDLDEEKAFQVSALIDRGIHADTIFFQRAADAETIKIEEVRRLLNNLQMTGDSWKRILVIDEIDRLTTDAANAMLKMIEEPPQKVLYVFTTSNAKQVLDTILSRVRRIDFQLMPTDELAHSLRLRFRLEDENKIRRVAELSLGRVAKAIRLMENSEHLEAYEDICRQIRDFLLRRDVAAAFGFIGQIHNDNLLIEIFLETALIVLRQDLREAGRRQDRAALSLAAARLGKLFETRALAETNANSRLLLENFILSL
jgi:DNA polymerase-3 subunit delta'